MDYQLFRLSLMERRQLQLVSQVPAGTPRADFLKLAFSGRTDFLHRGGEFSYVHVGTDGDLVVGRLGRKVVDERAAPPERAYAPVEEVIDRAVNLFLDTGGDRQRLAIQVDPRIGQPWPLASALVEQLNRKYGDAPWSIDIGPITDERTFWEAVEKHRDEITGITFEFFAPNPLGLGSSTREELQSAKDQNNARKVTVGLQNPDGIKVETPDIKSAVEYVSNGGGDVKLKSGKNTIFNSKTKARKIKLVEDEPVTSDQKGFWASAMRRLFGR